MSDVCVCENCRLGRDGPDRISELEAQRDEAAQEAAEMVEFLKAHLGWEWFWSGGWVGEDVKAQARQNAQKLRKFLDETGHAKAFSQRLDEARAQVAMLRGALQMVLDCITADVETDQAMGYPSVDISKALKLTERRQC
jgi:hypothetical protein